MKKTKKNSESDSLIAADPAQGFSENANLSRFRTNYNFKLGQYPNDLETNDEVSMTIPDQVLSMQQLLERYVAGRDVQFRQDAVYEQHLYSMEMPDPRQMDKVEKEMYTRQMRQMIHDYDSHHAAVAADKLAAEKKAKEDEYLALKEENARLKALKSVE